MVLQMGLVQGVFRTFPRVQKSRKSAASPSLRVPASGSSWTRAAYDHDEGFYLDGGGREWIKTSEKTWVDVHGQHSWLLVERAILVEPRHSANPVAAAMER